MNNENSPAQPCPSLPSVGYHPGNSKLEDFTKTAMAALLSNPKITTELGLEAERAALAASALAYALAALKLLGEPD